MGYKIKMCVDSFNDRWRTLASADTLMDARGEARIYLMAGIPSRKKELGIYKSENGRTSNTAVGYVYKKGDQYFWISKGIYKQIDERGKLVG